MGKSTLRFDSGFDFVLTMALQEPKYDRDFVKLLNAPTKVPMHLSDLPYEPTTVCLSKSIIAAFKEVQQTMPLDLALRLKQAVMQTMKTTPNMGSISKTKVSSMMPYQRLAGEHGIEKQVGYPDWFFMAAWLGPGHPFLEDIRKDMSDVWGVEFPTDEIIYPMIMNRETEVRLFNGEIAPTPNEDSIEERAKTIKKKINDSTVNGLSAAIKDHLPDALKHFGDADSVYASEKSLASTNRELEDARKQVTNLEKQLAESKASQARAQETTNSELQKNKSDMETLRKEIKQLKAAQNSTNSFKRVVEALRETVAGLDARVLFGEKKVEQEMNALRRKVAQSAEKAEKAVETGALVLSVLSTPGGQKRKMDEIS
ncbi:hypothetical protein FVEG_13140 [Fusarium verticillioides 7600]|uniref:Uncharacterized protein n=1 Tax=Gibberella moniliformis (strain M3125 / FGSC 7600) TaxID=334819 RepID=W7N4U2_GIBM7|nr:hypothetical protein FVEG_13140 [Fusarium verticillioides 7600]EWG55090.1 hypothetical protein FVEG_13140 [Fusarium verticillioides 7600]